VPVDQEGGQKTEIRAQRPVGRAPRRREVVEEFLLDGRWSFATPADAERAHAALVAAVGELPAATLSVTHSTLCSRFDGRLATSARDDAIAWAHAFVTEAVSGTMKYSMITDVRALHAPLEWIGERGDPARFVHVVGSLSFKSHDKREAALARPPPLPIETVGKTQLAIDRQGKATEATYREIAEGFARLARTARGRVSVRSPWAQS
jgi:hypothetical protein